MPSGGHRLRVDRGPVVRQAAGQPQVAQGVRRGGAIPRSEAPSRPRNDRPFTCTRTTTVTTTGTADPWGYGAFGLGYFYYSPWGWDPGYYGYYGYGAPRYSAYGYDDDLGSVKLKVKPRDAEVYVDGYFAGHVDDFDGISRP